MIADRCDECGRDGYSATPVDLADGTADDATIVAGLCAACDPERLAEDAADPTPVDAGCRGCGRTDTYRVNGLCPGCEPEITLPPALAERLRADNAALLAHNLAACAPATPHRPWRNSDWRFDSVTRRWTTADDPLADLSWLHAAAPGPRH